MPRYHYRAITATGSMSRGTLTADDERLAIGSLQKQGLTPLTLAAARAYDVNALAAKVWKRNPAITGADLRAITDQLATLLKAGLTIDRALATASELHRKGSAHNTIVRVMRAVREGDSLSQALSAEPGFPPYYLAMLRAGEASGTIPDALGRLRTFLATAHAMRSRVRGALIYPSILLAMILVTFFVIVYFVLPRFEALFVEAGAQLPTATRCVMALGHLITNHGLVLLGTIVSITVLSRHFYRQPPIRERVHYWMLKSRLTFGLFARIESARFIRALATLLRSGVQLPSALQVSRDMLSNEAMRRAADDLSIRVREGHQLSARMTHSGLFPPVVTQLTLIGEESGRLDSMLFEAAEILEHESQAILERALTLLVPALTLVMGAMVAALVASVLVGVLSLNDLAL